MTEQIQKLRDAKRPVLVFGPQILSLHHETFHRLRALLSTNARYSWIREVVDELPLTWSVLAKLSPQFGVKTSNKNIGTLSDLLHHARPDSAWSRLPSSVLTPLGVVTHLVHYIDYLELTGQKAGAASDVRALGFCTGLLASLAVTSSASEDEFRRNAAASIRLAMCVGALIDGYDRDSVAGAAQSLALMWSESSNYAAIAAILNRYEDAYTSVIFDEHRATVTVAEKDIRALESELRACDQVISAVPVSLYGRFHSKGQRINLEIMLELCTLDRSLKFEKNEHVAALQAILTEQADWYHTIRSVVEENPDAHFVCFGIERCIPTSLSRTIRSEQITQIKDLESQLDEASFNLTSSPLPRPGFADTDIAIVGMSCKFANADDPEELWKVLESGASQHREVPQDRFPMNSTFRPEAEKTQKWFGNFLRDHDGFDHKFFKKSPREAASMDPQQRLLLQVAYQALEQSGYFAGSNPNRNVGCFIGSCSTDYQTNIACHEPNAYSATGNLAAFIAGKISHYFGWTGPALVVDTACSSSAVAIHQACRAILAGECDQALAGGALVISSPLWFHNLAGASFLSSTGACKPFSADADGYCRGEGVAGLILKKMSVALADGDQILGCIAGTDVKQNENCTPIVVPNSPSLSTLFESVLEKSGLRPEQITVAEAHGTGTPVGDPAEWASIRTVLAGPEVARPQKLVVGSVKGHIGHTECTSGVAAVMKVLLMMHAGAIPRQASHSKLSPKLHSTPDDGMEVLTQAKAWNADFYAALINNYGASGSNASVIVTQPFLKRPSVSRFAIHESGIKHAFSLSGNSEDDIRRNATRLLAWIEDQKTTLLPSDLSLNLSRRSNLGMRLSLNFGADSLSGVKGQIKDFLNGNTAGVVTALDFPRPVVLCFAGQASRHVGLNRSVYNQFKILRDHLNACDDTIKQQGLESIFPRIFDSAPITDQVLLQTMMFAMQYSGAMSWIDSGIEVAAAVGHSFGELTALAVCGIVSVSDAIKLISRRALLIREKWGADSGAMLAVEGSASDINALLAASAPIAESQGTVQATVACHNGPTSWTLAGSTNAIEAVEKAVLDSKVSMRTKRLNVTNAFHSTLVEPLLSDLLQVTEGIVFRTPTIPLFHSKNLRFDEPVGSDFIAKHLRNPVYFNDAVQRIAKKYPSAVFLEAGSGSTITSMVKSALGSPKSSHFQAVNITSENVRSNVTDVTLALRKAGVQVTHWAHHKSQTLEYRILLLPPYQFVQSKHWLDLKLPQAHPEVAPALPAVVEAAPLGLFKFVGHKDSAGLHSRFLINTAHQQYEEYLEGHIIAGAAPICPATLQIDIVIESILTLHPEKATSDYKPVIRHIENQAPICRDASRTVWLDFIAKQGEENFWDWKITSTSEQGNATTYVTGEVSLLRADDQQYRREFKRYERLVNYERCKALLEHTSPDDMILGRNIYRAFSDVVDYGDIYRGVQRLVGLGAESAGRVVSSSTSGTWFDTARADCFAQVGGIWVNCMTERSPNTLYIANAIEQWLRSPVASSDNAPGEQKWDVFATHQKISDKAFCTDIFVFDAINGALTEVVLGIQYVEVSKPAMKKLLLRSTPGAQQAQLIDAAAQAIDREPVPAFTTITKSAAVPETSGNASWAQDLSASKHVKESSAPRSAGPNVANKLKTIIADLCGLELNDIKDDAQLGDLGIDSLMAMELCREIEGEFKIEIPEDDRGDIVDFPGLVACVCKRTGAGLPDSNSDSEAEDSLSVSNGSRTPSTAPTECSSRDQSTDRGDKSTKHELDISFETWMDAFNSMNTNIDQRIQECGFDGYLAGANLDQTELCVIMILEAFEKLGVDVRQVAVGGVVKRVPHVQEHGRLVDYLYNILDTEAGLIEKTSGGYRRTSQPLPTMSAQDRLEEVQTVHPAHADATALAFHTGSRLAEVLRGKETGVQLIFGSEKGRNLVSKLYGEWPLNAMYYQRMVEFFTNLAASVPRNGGPLRILEMGAGTAGTTKIVLPALAQMGIPVEYTFTDLSPAFVAQARKRFKQYDFVKYRVHDIEKPAPEDLVATQHLVLASNAVHATHDLNQSTAHIKQFLRPDGVLLVLEMTSPVIFLDLIFGLFEGWWMFNDGRNHAVTSPATWDRCMKNVGYGHVAWTGGSRPETNIEKLIMGMAQAPSRYASLQSVASPSVPISHGSRAARSQPDEELPADLVDRKAVIEGYVRKYTAGWSQPTGRLASDGRRGRSARGTTVLVTGASGSLGSYLVAHLARLPEVSAVVCMNRVTKIASYQRQVQVFQDRHIQLNEEEMQKVWVISTDTSLPQLGLSSDEYQGLMRRVTHICHNAWPMSAVRPVDGFQSQFQVMRNLVDLARDAGSHQGSKIGFEFVSSIAVVGQYPIWTEQRLVPEERMDVRSLIGNGYGDAKYICERMLDETLHRYPEHFHALSVRPGQIAGSKSSGAWNTHEHLSFLVKSCQTIKAVPAFEGELSWTPVEDVAGCCADLLMSEQAPHPIYHIDNPIRQPWRPMVNLWADALDIPSSNIVSFPRWLELVRAYQGKPVENPAIKLVDFLENEFVRMSCGGLLLDTQKSVSHSVTLSKVGPVSDEVARLYIDAWKQTGWLRA